MKPDCKTEKGSETAPLRKPRATNRNMHDSYCEVTLPFKSSPEFLEQYTNASGGIRTGKIMEVLDSTAGSVAYKHLLGPEAETVGTIQEQGFYVVTASVDRLDVLAPIYPPLRDLRLSGHVIHTGRSSMEIVVRLIGLDDGGNEESLMLGRFCMVCRDVRGGSYEVPQLTLATPEEKELYEIGKGFRDKRQMESRTALTRVPPTSAEAEALHSFYLKAGQYEDGYIATPSHEAERVWMSDTTIEKSQLMFPQSRNAHSKIFGGYLMRLAYELGFANATLFSRGPVRFLSLDKISFAKPVSIGSILRLRSTIIHSTASGKYPAIVHVRVEANVVDVSTGLEETTNDFRFTWVVEDGPPLSRNVVPKTYEESMLWLEGRRSLDANPAFSGPV
ncbi:Thioesterase/thiol ester dehydrase-isomerase [Thelephora terrestris]|uniref:Thioesterase/thiol ester dehydrase-isomerase n=1 Tax=Thelephora terrestris TaxID=56493 RepID=A0A9P6L6Q7_9AGAM|nr:Thioesterase/thiol ester dehydrase-isomerase [Thelephora terrestris]